MKITKEKIKSLNPCAPGWAYYLKNQESDLLTFLLKLNSDETAVDENGNLQGSNWARWLFTNLMTKIQCVEIAVYSAEQVIHIYESKYDSDAPRKAIEAAKNYIKNPSPNYAYAAYAYAGYAAADAADATRYAVASAYAASAASAAAAYAYAYDSDSTYYAADATDYAADAAEKAAYAAEKAAYAAARRELQEKIIMEAVRILDRKKP